MVDENGLVPSKKDVTFPDISFDIKFPWELQIGLNLTSNSVKHTKTCCKFIGQANLNELTKDLDVGVFKCNHSGNRLIYTIKDKPNVYGVDVKWIFFEKSKKYGDKNEYTHFWIQLWNLHAKDNLAVKAVKKNKMFLEKPILLEMLDKVDKNKALPDVDLGKEEPTIKLLDVKAYIKSQNKRIIKVQD